MPATLLRIADAVVDRLNAASLSQPVNAQRFYQPQFELQEMDTLHVSIVPRGTSSKQVARNKAEQDFLVDVGVQKRFSQGDAAELDPLMLLVEEIGDLFRAKSLAGFEQATCIKADNVPVYAQEHMENLRQFTSVLTLTFRMVR